MATGLAGANLEATDVVLHRVGITLAPTPFRAIVSVLARRAVLKIRGFSFTERHESVVPADELVAAGVASKLNQELTESLNHLERAFDALADLPGHAWDRQTARIFWLDCLMWLGRWNELLAQLPGHVEAAALSNCFAPALPQPQRA